MDQGQQITGAVSIPIIGDGDNGYGNPMNVKRTVKGYIRAGFAGIILEDQVYIALKVPFSLVIFRILSALTNFIAQVCECMKFNGLFWNTKYNPSPCGAS